MANKIMLGIAGVFLLLGLTSLIIGIVLPITLHNNLVSKGRDASRIFSTDHPDVWSNMPGDRGYNLTREFEFFEILNPDDYKYGIKPVARSVGTLIYAETRNTTTNFTSKDVTTYDGKNEVMFEFEQNANLELISGDQLLNKEIMAPNPEVYAQLTATRDASPWHVAIRALKQLVDFTINGFYRRAIVAQLNKRVNYYTNADSFLINRGTYMIRNGMADADVLNIFKSNAYGLADPNNLAYWADSCNVLTGGFERKLLMDFFGINLAAMNAYMEQF